MVKAHAAPELPPIDILASGLVLKVTLASFAARGSTSDTKNTAY